MPRLDVRLHLDATVEVDEGSVLELKTAIQAALERVTEPLFEAGAEFGASEFYVRPQAEEASDRG